MGFGDASLTELALKLVLRTRSTAAVSLVLLVFTVIVAVTEEGLWKAATPIVTLEVVFTARQRITILFVRVVSAIVAPVAAPALTRQTTVGVSTGELVFAAR